MKFSEAILKGFEMVEGRQCIGYNCRGPSERPAAVCVNGAINLALRSDADEEGNYAEQAEFYRVWSFYPSALNDGDLGHLIHEPMPWEHIYGMAVAAGL